MRTKKVKQKDTKYIHFYNANPKDKRTGDCVIRAIAVATGKSWDDILDDLTEISHDKKVLLDEKDCYGEYLEQLGFVKCKQMRKSDNTRYRGYEFLDKIDKDDIIVCHMGSHHLTAIKNKKIWDSWDCSGGCVGNYWIKDSK